MLLEYLQGIYRVGLRKWGKAQMKGALLAALLALAVLAIFPGFEIALTDWGVHLLAAFSGLSFAFYMFLIAPYYLWAHERRRRKSVETALAEAIDRQNEVKRPDRNAALALHVSTKMLRGAIHARNFKTAEAAYSDFRQTMQALSSNPELGPLIARFWDAAVPLYAELHQEVLDRKPPISLQLRKFRQQGMTDKERRDLEGKLVAAGEELIKATEWATYQA